MDVDEWLYNFTVSLSEVIEPIFGEELSKQINTFEALGEVLRVDGKGELFLHLTILSNLRENRVTDSLGDNLDKWGSSD